MTPIPGVDQGPGRSKRQVMVVEENPERCRHWCDLLTRHGLSVHAAPSPVLAIAAFTRQRPGVILAGSNQTDAAALIQQIRAVDAHVPIIPLTPDLSDEQLLNEVDCWMADPPASSVRRARPSVLLVDDEARSRDILKVFLELKGLEVVTADSGEEALAQVARLAPAAVILDVLMPGMNGLNTLKRIRILHPNLPVIIISQLDDEEIHREAVTLGAHDYLIKPFDFDQLKELILEALNGRGWDGWGGVREEDAR